MKHDRTISGKRKPVNLTLDTGIVAAAREMGINFSQTCENALRIATKRELERKWQEENRAAIEANNTWVEKNGLPLEKYRLF